MNKLLSLIILLSFSYYFSFAQTAYINDSIIWQKNKIFQYNENNTTNILSFKNGGNRTIDNLPVYFKKISINNDVEINNIELINVKYEVINNSELAEVQNLNNILPNPEITAYHSISRKQHFLNFEMVPLRRSEHSGNIERIIYFECKITYTPINYSKNKNQRSYFSNSKLANGKWYKIKVKESGMYKITYSQLVEMGFTNFNNIGVFGYGGMLSKIINDDYIDDLPERPVYKVDANSNSIFDQGDYLLFYADGPYNISFDQKTKKFSHEIHNYSEYSYYFVSDQGTWKEPSSVNSLANYDLDVTTYDDYQFIEKDSLNLIASGRRLFWRVFDNNTTHSFSRKYDNVYLDQDVNIKVVMAARSSQNSSFDVKFNNISGRTTSIGYTNSDAVFAYTNTFDENFKSTSNNFKIDIVYNKSTTASKAWLDYVSMSFKRKLSLSTGFVQFRDINNIGANKNIRFIINNSTSNTVVWDISDRINTIKINGKFSSNDYEFTYNTNDLKEFIAFNPATNFSTPIISGDSDVGNVENQNLHAQGQVDLIIISHPNFYAQAQGIKTLHEDLDNMKVFLTTPQKVYNEFSSGTPDVSAIRNFVKMFYDRASNNSELPQNLLLLGDGSYNNLSKNSSITNFILTYQSYESLKPGSSFVTDDFFVCMDYGEGEMGTSSNIDLGVGRIPVKTSTEADNYLNKIRSYYGSDSHSNWKNNILLVADDAEKGEVSFQETTNQISEMFRNNNPLYNIETIYMDDYEQTSSVQGHRYPEVNQALNDAIANGVFFVNWIGHGNPKSWAHEMILTINMIKTWRNTNRYPIFLTGTCDFSPFDNHSIVSGGEEILLHPTGGGIALFTTTRTVYGISGEILSKEFLKHVFAEDENSNINTLGMTVLKTKTGASSGTYNKNDFILLGDPAIIPPVPKMKVKTTTINGIAIEDYKDTIKAKSLVKFEGIITDKQGNIAEDFNGTIYPVVYDKFLSYKTRGNDGSRALEYEAQKNIIFKGQAKVTNGRFSFNFIVPIDIAYFFDHGKISYYASNSVNEDASGYFNSFIIGGTSDNDVDDKEGPEIELYMNNDQFIPGGITNERPTLIAKIKDVSGINTVGNGIGHDITLTIDDNSSKLITLNKFYESSLDDFTSGKINYPMSALSLGSHTAKVKAWDNFNNSNEVSIDFIVSNSAELSIDHIFNYPNPFSTNTHFYLAHNQPNINLDVLIQIFTVSGKHVKSIQTDVYSDGFQAQPIFWDGLDEYGDKIAKGVYIYKISVKHPNGDSVEKFEKLMILN